MRAACSARARASHDQPLGIRTSGEGAEVALEMEPRKDSAGEKGGESMGARCIRTSLLLGEAGSKQVHLRRGPLAGSEDSHALCNRAS